MARGLRTIRRGEVFWVDPGPVVGHEQGGVRPVLVISHGIFNDASRTVIAMAVTTRPPRGGFPVSCALESGGLPHRSWVKTWQVRTYSAERLGRRIGRVGEAEVDRAVEGLLEIVGR